MLEFEDAEQFVAAVAEVEEGQDLEGRGLCSAILDAGCDSAYEVMPAIAGRIGYAMPGFERGLWTEERRTLLAMLKALSAEDVWEFIQQYNKEQQ